MVKLNLLNLTPVTGTLTVYAKLNTPQTTAVPGNYQDSYTAATAPGDAQSRSGCATHDLW